MRKREIKIFVDFDGTITKEDVGEAIFRKFGDPEKTFQIIENLLQDKISSRQCWDELCCSVDNIKIDSLNNLIDSIVIDDAFPTFVKFCSDNQIEIIIISDGFDYYIDRILKRYGISELKYYSNKLVFDLQGKLTAEYPYYDSNFPTSANCKRNHIINHSSDEDYTIYIGDGNSDKEAAQFCDFIFAKSDLLKFCSTERISFYPFQTFDEVTKKISELINKKNLKKRHQAELKRKTAYTME